MARGFENSRAIVGEQHGEELLKELSSQRLIEPIEDVDDRLRCVPLTEE